MQQQIIAGVLIAVLAGAIGYWMGRSEFGGMTKTDYSMLTDTDKAGGLDVSGVVLAGGNAIAVNDQPPGTKVTVSMVALAAEGWVVIHEGRDGKPGNILGAQRFPAGQGQSGAVDLLRPTEEGRIYYAMLHENDGDPQFDHTKDLPPKDPDGNVIMMRFLATAHPTAQ